MCDFLANDLPHPGIYGLDAEFMNHHMDWVDWDKREANPLANLAKRKLDIALHGQRYSKGPFAIVIQICGADGHTIHLFLKSNHSLDYIREMNPDLYKRLTDKTADLCHTRNSLAVTIHHLFGIHLEKGFQGQGLACPKRPLPSNALGYAALDAIAH
uniref:Uncharacterized protein n=1 Tax=Romanomermis culicivorax TaxID=13658 RepID=A0A915IP68_ROMCU